MANVGALEGLEKSGVKPDLIIGEGFGAVVGALYADGVPVSQMKEILNLDRESLIHYEDEPDDPLVKFLTKNLKATEFKQLKIPFAVAIHNEATNEIAVVNSGNIVPIVKSSTVNHPILTHNEIYKKLPFEYASSLNPYKIITIIAYDSVSDSSSRNSAKYKILPANITIYEVSDLSHENNFYSYIQGKQSVHQTCPNE
jgi:hypothetical protein